MKEIYTILWSHPGQRPGQLLMAAGAKGEMLAAKIRLFLTAVLLLIPIINLVLESYIRENVVGLSAILVAFIISLLVYLLIDEGFNRPWLGFASSCFDVTLVSSALAIFFFFEQPHTAVNSKVIFESYFLAIGATCLRYDKRVCITAGLLALAEYFGIVLFAATHWDLNNPMYAPFMYGMFSWNSQISRLVMMLTATLLSTAVVAKTQELLRLSTSDPLTGLFNRGYFGERAEIEMNRSIRYGQPLMIAMIDVDRFKSFNDTYGHAAGDLVLRQIAAVLHQSFRKTDVVGRYGGDEFVIAMPETDASTAARKIEGFRQLIADTPIEIAKTGETVRVTISAGLAGFPDDSMKIDELVGMADRRLFQAKGKGRNQVVI